MASEGAAGGAGGEEADAPRGREQEQEGLLRREANAPTASCAASSTLEVPPPPWLTGGATSSTLDAPVPLSGGGEGDGEVLLEGWLLKTPRCYF